MRGRLAAYVVLDVGLVDAMGHRTLSVPLPSIYPIGEALVFQSIVLDQGQLFRSTPSVIVSN